MQAKWHSTGAYVYATLIVQKMYKALKLALQDMLVQRSYFFIMWILHNFLYS